MLIGTIRDVGPPDLEERQLDFERVLPRCASASCSSDGASSASRPASRRSTGTSPSGVPHAWRDRARPAAPRPVWLGPRSMHDGRDPQAGVDGAGHGPGVDVAGVRNDRAEGRPGLRQERRTHAGARARRRAHVRGRGGPVSRRRRLRRRREDGRGMACGSLAAGPAQFTISVASARRSGQLDPDRRDARLLPGRDAGGVRRVSDGAGSEDLKRAATSGISLAVGAVDLDAKCCESPTRTSAVAGQQQEAGDRAHVHADLDGALHVSDFARTFVFPAPADVTTPSRETVATFGVRGRAPGHGDEDRLVASSSTTRKLRGMAVPAGPTRRLAERRDFDGA